MTDILTTLFETVLCCSQTADTYPNEASCGVTPEIIIAHIICLTGITIFAIWLLRTSLGQTSLSDSPVRRHCMSGFTAFIPLIMWFVGVNSAMIVTNQLASKLSEWQIAAVSNAVICICGTLGIIISLLFAREYFVHGLKGFGLNIKTIGRDIPAAIINLFSVWPIIFMAVVLIDFAGRKYYGPQFEMARHEQLQMLSDHGQLSLKILIAVVAVIIAPVMEEIIYRGFIQTQIRSVTQRPWLAIIFSSAIFTFSHINIMHWPVLFILGACLGYSFEKSGSLFRAIFIHIIFNAISIIGVLIQ